MKKRALLPQAAAALAAWGCLSGLALVRLWAVLYGHVPSLAIPAAAAVLAALPVAAFWRWDCLRKLLLPFGPTWKSALVAAPAFLAGALLDTSYSLFTVGDMAIGGRLFRTVCALGSGLTCAVIVLAVVWAARTFGPVPKVNASTLLALVLVVNVITALHCAGTATVY